MTSRRRFMTGGLLATALAACGEDSIVDAPVADEGPGRLGPQDAFGSKKDTAAADAGPVEEPCADPFEDGEPLGTLSFQGEGLAPVNVTIGVGLDARRYTDVGTLSPGSLITETQHFFVRTKVPDQLDLSAEWSLRIDGRVAAEVVVDRATLESMAEPMGVHLLESATNALDVRFGQISVAEWDGVPVAALLALADLDSSATSLRVEGFDGHSQPSGTSTIGASWVFPLSELEAAGAFVATRLNGEPLGPDHGQPARLIVPGWYGCCAIKWLTRLTLTDSTEPSTEQMLEFAAATHQVKAHALAADFAPARVEAAAMPVRVERFALGDQISHRVWGITWGGEGPPDELLISFDTLAPFEPVTICGPPDENPGWRLWWHQWTPTKLGVYELRMRIGGDVPQRRLDSGHYNRAIRIESLS